MSRSHIKGQSTTHLDVSELLAPVTEDSPQGTDLSYSSLFDDIREARRSDDPALSQGEWVTALKTSNWHLVRSLCEKALRNQTKDLQIAAWYIESLVSIEGFPGLAAGLELLYGLLNRYWDSCFPLKDGRDCSERAGKIEWLNHQLPIAIQKIPITSASSGGYNLLQWEESRRVENLGLKSGNAKADAIADGKLSGELFDIAIKKSGIVFYEHLYRDTSQLLQALDKLNTLIQDLFGEYAPSMLQLRQSLTDCSALAARLKGDPVGQPQAQLTPSITKLPEQSPLAISTGSSEIATRANAIQTLHRVAQYFRSNEPHSPVALLVERAARWAEMPMEQWLAAVIKDQATLSQLHELLDIPRTGDEAT